MLKTTAIGMDRSGDLQKNEHREPMISDHATEQATATMSVEERERDGQVKDIPPERYDIIVIGAGSGGLGVAGFAAKIGLRTLLIERSDERIGGDCLNHGCVPSKALLHVANLIHKARAAAGFGMDVSGQPDIELVKRYIRSTQAVIREHENASFLREQGMDVALGTAFFVSADEVMVKGVRYAARRIVIATGSKPRELQVRGVQTVERYNNENIFDIGKIPEQFLVVGGGPIGVEIGQAFQRMGSQVTLLQNGDRLLPHDEREVATVLRQRLENEGMRFIFDAEIEAFPDPQRAIIKKKDSGSTEIKIDALFIAIGREPTFEELHVGRAGIEVKDGRIVHDQFLRTTNPRVFVCGDVVGDLMFSHAAELHLRLLINNFFSPLKKKLDNKHMSWVTFTDPQVATFGMDRHQLREEKITHETFSMDLAEDDRAVIEGYRYGHMMVHTRKKGLFRKECIVGGTMVAPNAGELVQELILAMRAGLSTNEIFDRIYPYPVASRVNQQLILQQKEKMLAGPLLPVMRLLFRLWN